MILSDETKFTALIIILVFIFFCGFITNAGVSTAPLTWSSNPVIEEYASLGYQTGYKVYYKITEDCSYEESYNYSVDVGDQLSFDVFGNRYIKPGTQYKFQVSSYYIDDDGAVYESILSEVIACYEPQPLGSVDVLKNQQQQNQQKGKDNVKNINLNGDSQSVTTASRTDIWSGHDSRERDLSLVENRQRQRDRRVSGSGERPARIRNTSDLGRPHVNADSRRRVNRQKLGRVQHKPSNSGDRTQDRRRKMLYDKSVLQHDGRTAESVSGIKTSVRKASGIPTTPKGNWYQDNTIKTILGILGALAALIYFYKK